MESEQVDIYDFLHTKWQYSKLETSKFKFTPRKTKRFSLQETVRLTANIKQYLRLNNLEYPDDIKYFINPKKRTKNSNFYRNISKGICRTLYSVYRHVHRHYSSLLYQRGKWEREEEDQLIQLLREHKGNWNVVSESLGRSRIDCIDKACSSTLGSCQVGRWGPVETDRLMESVCYQLREKGLEDKLAEPIVLKNDKTDEEVTISSQIDWNLTSMHVGTRTRHQCLCKWANSLCTNTENPTRLWVTADDVKLIEVVLAMRIRDEYNVDWLEVLKRGKWQGRTSSWIQSKWSRLVHCIPGYKVKFFYQKCAFLREITLPVLKKHLEIFQQQETTEVTNELSNSDNTSVDSRGINTSCLSTDPS